MGSRLSLARSSTSSQLSREQQDYLNASGKDLTSSFRTSKTSFGAPGAVVDVEAPKQTHMQTKIHVTSASKENKNMPALRERVSLSFGGQRTMRVRRNTKRFSQHKTLKATMSATLGNRSGKLADLVKCPKGENPDEWIAVNTFLFYEVAVQLFDSCKEICTAESCEQMSAGPKFKYLWMDGKQYKKPTSCSAPKYIGLLFDWIFGFLSDPSVFPQEDNVKLPRNFRKIVRRIYKRLFRLYAHLFHQHLNELRKCGMEAHLLSAFRHFTCFVVEFKLVDPVDLQPVKSISENVLAKEGFIRKR